LVTDESRKLLFSGNLSVTDLMLYNSQVTQSENILGIDLQEVELVLQLNIFLAFTIVVSLLYKVIA